MKNYYDFKNIKVKYFIESYSHSAETKVNKFIEENEDINILSINEQASQGFIFVSIHYVEKKDRTIPRID